MGFFSRFLNCTNGIKSHNAPHIVVRGDITIIGRNLATEAEFKNCTRFIKYITKIDGTTIGDSEDLEFVMPMYNLLEYSLNCSDTKR